MKQTSWASALLIAILAVINGGIGAYLGYDIGIGWVWGGVAGAAAFAVEATLHYILSPVAYRQRR
jgi:hypothetical protein